MPPTDRIVGAPASWGVCEVPGWGFQLDAERVLSEMQQLGLKATELGPDGFLPGDPRKKARLLNSFGLTALGAFCPLVLHDPARPVRDAVLTILDAFAVLGAKLMVIAAATGIDSYDERASLTESQWHTLIGNLEYISTLAAEHDVVACIHPHMGTLVQNRDEVSRILDGSDIPICLDSGHLTVAGCDLLEIAHTAPQRIGHVHLKDVDHELATAVQEGRTAYSDAVRKGLYTPLGDGDVNLTDLVRFLETSGYTGWYVPELDRMLPDEPDEAESIAGMRKSIEFLDVLMSDGA